MAGTLYSFKRYEEKYMLTDAQFEMLWPLLDQYMLPDKHGQSTICNIYYDTDTYELIRKSLEKPIYKEKFRVRSYGIPTEDSSIFVEIKKKYDGVVYKRRVEGNLKTAKDFINKGIRLNDNEQIQNEIEWFLKHYKPSPKMYIAYERQAYFGKENSQFRLTFDKNIRYRLNELSPEAGDAGEKIIPDDVCLMELKTLDAVPMWLTKALSELECYPVSFSKYGTCYKRELMKKNISG